MRRAWQRSPESYSISSSSAYSPRRSGRKPNVSCNASPARSAPSDGTTENGGGTESTKRPSALPVLRRRKASVALARTGCSPKSTPSGNSKHARGPRAEIITTNFSRSERQTSSHE